MTRRAGLFSARAILGFVAAVAVVGGLTACAPAKIVNLHPHAGPSKVASSPTPTPTPTPLAAPVTRVTQSCSQLVSTSALTTSIGTTVPAVTPPTQLDSQIIFTQAGALTCNWSTDYAKDAQQGSNHLVAWVLPDVSTANWTVAAKALAETGETKTTIISGDAYGWCNPVSPKGTLCSIDTRTGTTWLSFEVESLSKSFATSALGLTHFAALLNPIVTAAGAASFITEPKWDNPAATATPATCSAALPSSEIKTASGVAGVGPIGPDLSDQYSLAEYWGAEAGLGEVDCDLASPDQQNGFFGSIVPGGSWAWSLEQASDSSQPGYTTVPGLGTQSAQYTNSNSGGVSIDWVRGGNLCNINVALAASAKDAAVALALATYINGEISN